MKRDSEQQATLFVAIMREAEKETGMRIAVPKSEDRKLYIVDDITGDKFELMTTVEKVKNRRKKQEKKSQKYSSSKK